MSNVIDISERIADLVTNIPADTVAMHGGSDSLEVKIQDLISPPEDDTPKKRGRPKGSKNKTKQTNEETPPPAPKRGRPKGSKNKIKDPPIEVTPEPKKRGRPKGSKNKVKDPPLEVTPEPKKRGRPKGSKNKTQ